MNAPTASRTEVIAFCSGKGGTGKTSLIAALGYALCSSGHSVLMVDADRATDGFSLFIMGPEGTSQIGSFAPASTFAGLLEQYRRSGTLEPQPHRIDRLASNDHGLSYEAIISGKALYGDDAASGSAADDNDWNRQYERPLFQQAVRMLFDGLRAQQRFDYVLVDTRGGFSYESTDVAAAADSFVLVTEATYTNFYQDRNLVDRINAAALQMQTRSLLRGIIVNKSTEPPETAFRNELVREFGLRFEDTLPVQLDVDAARAYKLQKAVYVEAPASKFSHDSLKAFQQLLRVVTAQWPAERARAWNALVERVDAAISVHNQQIDERQRQYAEREAQFALLVAARDALGKDLEQLREASQRDGQRQEILIAELKEQAARREAQVARELESKEELHRRESERLGAEAAALHQRLAEAELRLKSADTAEVKRRTAWFTTIVLAVAGTLVGVAIMFLAARSRGPEAGITGGSPASAPVASALPVNPVEAAAASAATAAAAAASVDGPVDASQVTARPVLPLQPPGSTLRYCRAGSYNVIVASHKDPTRAQAGVRDFQRRYPGFEFAAAESVSPRGDNLQFAVFSGLGLTLNEASALAQRLRTAGIVDAYVTRQSIDCGSPALAASK